MQDEEIMMKRRRFKQTTTLAERLTQQADRLRKRAGSLSPGPEQTLLWRKVRQAETALRIEAWLVAPGDHPPSEEIPLMPMGHKRRQKSPPGSAS
jgi:hypothetical protein